MNRSIRILLCLIVLPFLIFADSESDFDVVKCYESAKTNEELRTCALQDQGVVEKKLSQIYSAVLELIKSRINADSTIETDSSTEVLNRLMAAEKAWLAYKEAQCQFEGTAMLGEPGEEVVVAGCQSRLIKERIKILEESLPKSESEEH